MEPTERASRAPASPAAAGLVLALIVAAVGARLVAGLVFPGFHTGDDVEIAESALDSIGAIDYSPLPIRNEFLPRRLLGPVLGLAGALGLAEPWAQLLLLRAIFALTGGGLTVWLTYRLGLRLFERRQVAAVGALLVAFHPLALAFGATTLPRVASTAAVVGAALLVYRAESRLVAHLFGAGILLAAASACRYSEAIFLLPLVAVAIAAHPRRWLAAAGSILAGFAAGSAVLVGVEDWWFYGTPFHSLSEFVRYTLVEKQASARVAVQPGEWYLRRIFFWLPATLVPALFFVDRSTSAARALAIFVAVPILVLSFIHHKDLRYLHGVLPFLSLLAAAGLAGMAERGGRRRRLAAALIALTVLFGLYRAGRVLIGSSNASVRAARILTDQPDLEAVGLTQRWAFGGRIHLRRPSRLVELGVPPETGAFRLQIRELDAVAIHRRIENARPELRGALEEAGFTDWRSVAGHGDDAVTILTREVGSKPGSPRRSGRKAASTSSSR